MGFESIGNVMEYRNFERADDLLGFFEQVSKVVRSQAHVEVESVRYKNNIVGVTVTNGSEASEIRLRHIQIERSLRKITGREILRVSVRIIG